MFNELVIETNNLTKIFDGKEVISDCHMSVERGTIYGFLGANGAGKTTVFKLLSGLLKPTMGQMKILGKDSAGHFPGMLSEIGLLIETPIFFENLSASDNLAIHLTYMGKDKTGIADALERVGLVNTGHQPVSSFSLGMRQRLAIARAFIHDPQLLFLDEPINGLDPMGIKEMRKLFKEPVREKGMTCVISSHILSEIEHIADKIGVIAKGKIIKEVSMAEVKAAYPLGLEDYFMVLMGGQTDEKINQTGNNKK